MAKYIDADKLKRHYAWWDDESKKIFDEIIDLQPAADVQPVRRGRWIDLKCDQCGQVDMSKPNYCPNCGAKMEGEDE